MQSQFEKIEAELVNRLYKEFIIKFDGNKSKFAKASLCSETTVRRVFRNEQRMTVDLLLRFSTALGVKVSDLFNNLEQ